MAYTHASPRVVATFRALNVPASVSARPSDTRIAPAPGSRPIVAYVHSVQATFWALKVPAIACLVLKGDQAREVGV